MRHREASQAVRAVFERFTSLIEPVSLDEAYLMSAANRIARAAPRMAEAIRAAIRHEGHHRLGRHCLNKCWPRSPATGTSLTANG